MGENYSIPQPFFISLCQGKRVAEKAEIPHQVHESKLEMCDELKPILLPSCKTMSTIDC